MQFFQYFIPWEPAQAVGQPVHTVCESILVNVSVVAAEILVRIVKPLLGMLFCCFFNLFFFHVFIVLMIAYPVLIIRPVQGVPVPGGSPWKAVWGGKQ